MRIAFVRGPFLNPWELQTYLPLAQRHDFRTISADWLMYEPAFNGMALGQERPHVWAASSARIHPHFPIWLNRLRSWTLGESYGLDKLAQAVGAAEILHTAETHSTMTYQCLQIRHHSGCKVVATIWENIPHMGETHPRRRARKRHALQELDGFLAVTETSRRMLLEEGAPADRIEVIPMAVDLAHFQPAPKSADWNRAWGLVPGERVVLFIGRWVAEKGIRELLQAIPEILGRASSPVRFCFVGAGPLEGELQAAAARHPGRLQIIPFVSYDQLPVLHNMADILVLPSKSIAKWQEQFGYVLAESMACGKAIVTTRSGSIPDVVGKSALLVPESDVSALGSSLLRLLNSDAERHELGQSARKWALEQFDAERNSRRIEGFYERVLGRRP